MFNVIINGKTVAAQNGTNQQIMVEEQLTGATLELITKIPDGVNMVKNGRVDALAVPKTVYDSVLAENDDLEVAEFAFDFEGGNYIASVKGETALAEKIQELINNVAKAQGGIVIIARAVRPGEDPTVDTSKAYINENPKYPQIYYDKHGIANPFKNDVQWKPKAVEVKK